jgi:hypothetical protein
MPGVRFRLIDVVKSIDVNRQARGSTVTSIHRERG